MADGRITRTLLLKKVFDMAQQISLQNTNLALFLSQERYKVHRYLSKKFSSFSEEEIDDIYQESSLALYLNLRDGKLTTLTCTLFAYFLRICVNQSLKRIDRKKKEVAFVDENALINQDCFLKDKIDDLYNLCNENEEEETVSQSEQIVRDIIENMPDTCKNIFRGYYWDNLTTATIADMYGFANANSVKTQKYKCLQKFRNRYNELMKK